MSISKVFSSPANISNVAKIATGTVLLVGLLLRLYVAFRNNGFWSDDLATIYFSKIPFMESITRNNSAPAFELLLRCWMFIFGDKEIVIKSLPVLISSFSLFVAFFTGSPLFLLLLALNPFSILAASQVKSTALFEFATLVYIIALFRYCFSDKPQSSLVRALCFLLFSSIFCSVHYLALVVIESFGILLVFRYFKDRAQALGFVLLALPILAGVGLLEAVINFDHLGYLRNRNLFGLFQKDQLWEFLRGVDGLSLLAPIFYGIFFGLLSKTVRQQIAFRGFLLAIAIFVLISEMMSYSVLIWRYLIPLNVLFAAAISYSLPTDSGVKKLKVVAALFSIFLFVNFVDMGRLSLNSESWKLAAQELCSQQHRLPLTVWGTGGLAYYFTPECADIRYIETDLSNYCGDILLPSQYVKEFSASFDLNGPIEKVKEFGGLSTEPVSLLRKKCASYK